MAGNQLPLSLVVDISVSSSPTGVNAYNTSNLALFSADTPDPVFDSGYKIYFDAADVGTDFGTDSQTYAMALAVFSQSPNILAPGGYLVVIPYVVSETLAVAIARTENLVQYFGVMSSQIESQADMLAAAAVIQSLNKIAFFVQNLATSVQTAGSLDLLRSGDFTHSRGLLYVTSTLADALNMQAAYAGRALSTIFSGSNTTQTMNLKQLAGIQPDPGMTPTIWNNAQTAGADTYVNFQGFPAVSSSGANEFFDSVYNLQWFVGALQIAGFNYLAAASTKIPQTETGMDGLKGAYRSVCTQSVVNQYVAPGSWTSPTTFGVQADLLANVAQFGYYIYSSPISQQLQADRVARIAPLVQIAVKLAGAIHKSTVVVNVNP